MSAPTYRRVLRKLAEDVMPCMPPSLVPRLADFYTDAYGQGGAIALMALHGLYLLMTEHNVDYPAFYAKLYALLGHGDVFHAKHRAKFFGLLDTFLGSTHLPAYLVAAFCKRLARLALSAPPAGPLFVLPFVYNMIKRHPAAMALIHRPRAAAYEGGAVAATVDPFDAAQDDPAQCRALESSLWEVLALRTHYLPAVSSLAAVFEKEFAAPQYPIEQGGFTAVTYASLFDREATSGRGPRGGDDDEGDKRDDNLGRFARRRKKKKKKKKTMPLAFEKPAGLFGSVVAGGGAAEEAGDLFAL